MWLFWLFLALPIIEIALFIQVGGAIGLWPTLALVLIAAALGLAVMRAQGAHAVAELQRSMNELRDPARPMAHGALIMLGGLLLLIPGFFTDAVGLLLLIPPVRELIMRRIAARVRVSHVSMEARTYKQDPYRPPFADGVIDGDYVDEDELRERQEAGDQPPPPDAPPPDAPLPPPRRGGSGWTRH